MRISDWSSDVCSSDLIGTRGRRPDSRWEWGWDIAVYRAWLRDEIQLFDLGGGMSRAANADRTVHQGSELGFDVTVAKGLFTGGPEPERLRIRPAYTSHSFPVASATHDGHDTPARVRQQSGRRSGG